MYRPIRSLLGIALVISGFMFASSAAWAAEPIKIGALLSVTGPAAFLGDPELKTLQLEIEKINESGGILGRNVKLVHYDDGGDSGKANTFTKRLIESDDVAVIIGGSTTGTTMAAVPLVQRAGMPLVSLAGGAVITNPVKKWVFKTPGTDTHSIQKIYEDMKARGLTKMALLAESSGVGQSSKNEALKYAKDYGITIVMEETFGSKDTSMTPQLTRIKNEPGVDSILVTGFGQGPAVVTTNYHQLGMKLPLYHTHGVASAEFIELTGKASEGVRMSSSAQVVADQLPDSDPQKAVLLAYRDSYMKRYNQEPSSFGGYAHDALSIVVDAIKRAGSTDKSAVREAIEQTKNHVGTAGIVNMSATDHVGLDLSSFRMIEIRNGAFRLLK